MRLQPVILLFAIVMPILLFSQEDNLNRKDVRITSEDGLQITADFYVGGRPTAPLIILFHQAGFSRGSYRAIAPRLNALGFDCLAIDQRSGDEANGIENETKKQAVKAGKKTEYVNAIPDVQAAFLFAKNSIKPSKIILWGSSYSASLVIYMGSEHAGEIDGILAFSPGEYFKIDDKKIEAFAPNIDCPVFITSGKSEEGQWKDIYDAIPSRKEFFLPTEVGAHGSKALWPDKKGSEAYWTAVEKFLKTL